MPKNPPVDAGAEEPPAEPDPPRWWRYMGPPGRIYTNVPVTPDPGDIIFWPESPATDGAWEPTDAEPTRQPDNWRPELPAALSEETTHD